MEMEIEKIEWGETYIWRVNDVYDAGMLEECSTDNAYYIRRDDERNERRFERLSFGCHGSDPRQIVDMELIWMVGMLRSEWFWSSAWRLFIWALERSDPSEGFQEFKKYSFDYFKEKAIEAGVDYQIESYLMGIPLEHVLGE